ncbi:MAG: hypothetical protein ACOZCO_12120 [Bacteroidota bacterium]
MKTIKTTTAVKAITALLAISILFASCSKGVYCPAYGNKSNTHKHR